MLAKIKHYLYANRTIFILLGALFVYFLVQKTVKHFGFRTDYYDLFFFDQPLWNVTQGKGLYLSTYDKSFIGMHFYPILWVISLFYFIYPTPIWLFIIHAFVLVLAAYPILKVAESHWQKKGVYTVFTLLVSYVVFRQANLHDFHGEIILSALISWTAYGLYRHKNDRWLWLICIVAPFVKESAFTFSIALGMYLFLVKRYFRMGIGMIVYGFLMGGMLTSVIMPMFNQDSYTYLEYYSYLGDSFIDKIKTLLFRPDIVASHVLKGYKIGYLILLLLPLGGYALMSPYLLLGLGVLAQNLLSDKIQTCDVFAHYSIPLFPVLFFASIDGFRKIQGKTSLFWKRYRSVMKGFVVFFIGVNVLLWVFMDLRSFHFDQHTKDSYRILKQIPKNAHVSASTHYFVHLHYRDNIEIFPKINEAEYVVVEDVDPFWPVEEEHGSYLKRQWNEGSKGSVIKGLILGERGYSPLDRVGYARALNGLRNNSNYRLIDSGEGVFLFHRKASHESDSK